MIIDIENKGKFLRVSHFSEEGDLKFLDLPIPDSERFVWERCSASNSSKEKEWTCWQGQPIKKSKSERYDKYRIAQILGDAPKEITKPLWEFQIPKKYFVDIEVEITEEMAAALDTENAKNRVISIGIATDKCKLILLGIDPLSHEQQVSIHNKVNQYFSKTGDEWSFKYKQFETEYDMMYTFFKDFVIKMPFITGWNWLGYDWPYLLNRARKLGIDPKICSPGGYLIGKNQLPAHICMVDYLEIYKKWDRVIKIKESNRLDYVAEKAIGLKKIEYSGTLRDLYQSDFENFIYYNAVDCALVHYIDQKLKTQQTFFKIAQISGVEINRSLSPVWSTEMMMLRKFLERKQVFLNQDKKESHVKFTGGYVKDPILGLHEWIACYDFASLYPNTMVQWGISPESYKGKGLQDANPEWIKTASGAFFGPDSESPIIRTIIKDLYSRRRKTKNKMLELQIEIDKLEKSIKE